MDIILHHTVHHHIHGGVVNLLDCIAAKPSSERLITGADRTFSFAFVCHTDVTLFCYMTWRQKSN